jgi:cell division septum initiation protein DivIVA
MRLRGNVHKRLAEVREEVQRLRQVVAVLDEQVAHAEEVADEAATRALVSSTPLADREHRSASDDLRRVKRERDEQRARVAALLAESDALLDKLADSPQEKEPW